ncbi:transporter [Sulfobacillus harzensis]|uniref:Transporter n=1 Tax=Sulfobacillus harzensis TaxID=2729629 RepID=A0A7Y0Q0E4_9FIRM|nr:transporter [Sulfobacillus harzensis]NMP20928.1 transporter [Sulfobacillus harzensis]
MKGRSLGVAFTYVGAVVGAGFASGQEIYQFFGRFGTAGVWGIGIAGALFAWLGYLALESGRRGRAASFGALLESLYPASLVRVAEGVTTAFLVIGLGVVAAGGGAASQQIIGLPVFWGALATSLFIVLVVARGTDSVVRVNVALVPYLVVLVMMVALLTWHQPARLRVGSAHGWALSALLYLSYNIFTGIMVLIGIGPRLTGRRDSVLAAVGGAVLLSGLALMEHHALSRLHTPGALPMLDLAARVHPVWGTLYGVSLWIALFTTGVAEAYALRTQYGRRVLWLVGATFLFSIWGFQRLVATLYPLMGVVAVVLWIPLVYRPKQSASGG